MMVSYPMGVKCPSASCLLVALPVMRRLGDLQLAADSRDVRALGEHPVSVLQLADNLLRGVLASPGHDQAFLPTNHGRARLPNPSDQPEGARSLAR